MDCLIISAVSPFTTRLDQLRVQERSDVGVCTSCGVCCFSALETYVRVTGEDWSRLGERADQFAHFIGHRAYMKMKHDHCAALLVATLPSGAAAYWCAIYAERPQVCRDLERGSPACEGERVMKSERAKQWKEMEND